MVNHINLRLFLFRITLHYRQHVWCVLLMCHTATDSINKLYIALFENAIVLIWRQTLSRSTGRQVKCVASHKSAFYQEILNCRNHAGIFPQFNVFLTRNSLSELHSPWVTSSDPIPLACVTSGVDYNIFEHTGNLYLYVEYVTGWWLDILISTLPLWDCLSRMIYNPNLSYFIIYVTIS